MRIVAARAAVATAQQLEVTCRQFAVTCPAAAEATMAAVAEEAVVGSKKVGRPDAAK